MMKTFQFEATQLITRPRGEVFAFFSDAANLEAITPTWLKFVICSPQPITLRRGTLIDYRLRVHGVPIRWRSLISVWEPPARFVDEQVRGPYRLWHHEHRFEEVEGGTNVHDRVRYAPLGGALINSLFVRRDVERIFAYRAERLQSVFNSRTTSRACA